MATTWKKIITTADNATYLNSAVTLSDFSTPGGLPSSANFLNETGAWSAPSGSDTDTTYSTSIPVSTTKLRLTAGGDGSGSDDIEFIGGTNVTVTRTSASVFTLTSTDTQPLDNAGVIGKVLTGVTSGSGTVVATDTIVAGISRLEGRTATNDGKATNVSTNLAITGDTGARVITSSDGNNATIPVATTSVSGVMSTGIFDAVVLNTAKSTDVDHNVTTNLTITGSTGARTIVSSDGTNATIPVATALASGVMSQASFNALDAIEASATADQSAVEIIALLNSDLGGDFIIGNQTSDKMTVTGDFTVGGDLVISGSTVTANVTTITTEDHSITLAKDDSPTVTTGTLSGIDVQTSGTPGNNPAVIWDKDEDLTGWKVNDSSGTSYAVAVMQHHATTTPTNEAIAGVGSFYFEADAGALYVRTL